MDDRRDLVIIHRQHILTSKVRCLPPEPSQVLTQKKDRGSTLFARRKPGIIGTICSVGARPATECGRPARRMRKLYRFNVETSNPGPGLTKAEEGK